MRTSFHHQSEAQPPNGPLTAATSPDTPSPGPTTQFCAKRDFLVSAELRRFPAWCECIGRFAVSVRKEDRPEAISGLSSQDQAPHGGHRVELLGDRYERHALSVDMTTVRACATTICVARGPFMQRFLFCFASVALILASAPVSAADKAWDDCASDRVDQRVSIAACTTYLKRSARQTAVQRATAYTNRGISYKRTGKLDQAIADFGEAIRLNPQYAFAYHQRGDTYSDKGEYNRAINDLNEAIRLDPKDADFFTARGFSYDKLADLDRALADYTEAIRLDPKSGLAYSNRGDILTRKGEHRRAAADHDQAVRLDPKNANYLISRGVNYDAMGDLDRALADFAAAVARDPKNALAYSNRGGILRRKGDLQRALADYEEAIRLEPSSAVAYVGRGYLYRSQTKLDRALRDFEQAVRLDPKSTEALVALAQGLREVGSYDRALAALTKAIDGGLTHADLFAARGTAFNEKGDNARAIVEFDQAIRLDPMNFVALANRGLAYKQLGDVVRALANYDAAHGIEPANVELLAHRGEAFGTKGDFDRAIADYNEAIRLCDELLRKNPKDWSMLLARAHAFNGKGDADRAIADADEAIRLHPDETGYTSRGTAYALNGDHAAALRDFDAALSFNPDAQEARKGREKSQAKLAERAAGGPSGFAAGGAPAAEQRVSSPDQRASPSPASPIVAENRVALIIGNGQYKAVGALANPGRDAELIAKTLRGVGFQSVQVVNDANREQFIQALRSFRDLADKADWAVVYYAGHGMEMQKTNYLLPVDARLKSDRDVEDEAVALDRVLVAIEGAKKMRIVILDACRDNPFLAQMARSLGTRSVGRGLARIEPHRGTLVAYAARDGEVALDGTGGNSPFVIALAKHVSSPGIEIGKLFRLVRDDVLAATGDQQEPFVYGSLPGPDFFFREK